MTYSFLLSGFHPCILSPPLFMMVSFYARRAAKRWPEITPQNDENEVRYSSHPFRLILLSIFPASRLHRCDWTGTRGFPATGTEVVMEKGPKDRDVRAF